MPRAIGKDMTDKRQPFYAGRGSAEVWLDDLAANNGTVADDRKFFCRLEVKGDRNLLENKSIGLSGGFTWTHFKIRMAMRQGDIGNRSLGPALYG